MRFLNQLAKIKLATNLHFQFSLWDSQVFCILFLTFYLFFQFSLWDSQINIRKIAEDDSSFNSLYEIHKDFSHMIPVSVDNFQFSLWDSILAKSCTVKIVILSILFMRFSIFNFAPLLFASTFNSLYEIPKSVELVVWLSLTFNSLYEIQHSMAEIEIVEIVNFQFSLWDSTKSRPRSKSPSKLSILFMRFYWEQ